MATIALDKTTGSATGSDKTPAAAHSGFFGTLRGALAEAWDMRVRLYSEGYLAHLTDAELAQHGMTRDQMIRRTHNLMTEM